MAPSLSAAPAAYGVALVGEALGEDEAEAGRPFVGRSGLKLTRLIEWAGLDRARFDVWNAVWCRPPGNVLEGTEVEHGAISHCQAHHWGGLPARVRVVVPMGNVALSAFTGRKGILATRGYVQGGPSGTHLLPTVHPSFIQRGQSKYSAAFIHDIQKAVELARVGLPIELNNYVIDPSPSRAYEWAQAYRETLTRAPQTRLAFDIETPYKGEDEGDLDPDEDISYQIDRIGFSYRSHHALTVPWSPPYMAAIRLLMESEGEKVVWNASFDCPRIKASGVGVNGLVHDGMVAWHILHSDLPKGLAFVATFTCPWQPAWKHLSHSAPGFYNATDADVEWRSMEVIDRELKVNGLYDVYESDVLQIEPILVHMSLQGMPIDAEIRADRATQLADRLDRVLAEMEALVPLDARRVLIAYKETPKDTTGLRVREGVRERNFCPQCGLERPRKDHFRVLKKKVNPCGGLVPVTRTVEVDEYYRLADFTPSRDQLIRYNRALGRPLPTVPDPKTKQRKVSMNEKALKELMRKFPLDGLYPAVLTYRELDKLAGTYIGRPVAC